MARGRPNAPDRELINIDVEPSARARVPRRAEEVGAARRSRAISAREFGARFQSDDDEEVESRGPAWDPEHLAELKKGRASWNAWSKANPDTTPNLADVDFTNADEFKGTEIWGKRWKDDSEPERALLARFDLSDANLYGADLSGAYLWDANLSGANLYGADLSGAVLVGANLSGAYLNGADLRSAYLGGANLSNAYLGGANLSGANLNGADLSGAVLGGANLSGAYLNGAGLSGADLNALWTEDESSGTYVEIRTDLSRARLIDADLRDASLTRAMLRGADFSSADLSRADLISADISGADLSFAVLEFTNVREIEFDRTKLKGRCKGVGAIDTLLGNLRFQEAVRESAFISGQWESLWADFPHTVRPKSKRLPAGLRSDGWRDSVRKWQALVALFLQKTGWLASRGVFDAPRALLSSRAGTAWETLGAAVFNLALGAGLALLAALIADPSARADAFAALVRLDLAAAAQRLAAGMPLGHWSAIGAAVGLVLGSWYARLVFNRIWSFLDYGRSWVRVMVMAGLLVGLFGFAYQFFDGRLTEFIVSSDLRDAISRGGLELYPDQHWFYPWFVAAMGFCTLGIGDLITPLNGAGQILILLNIIAGFVTLGLLLAVLTDQFSSRR